MRNKWLASIVCALLVIGLPLLAAEKNRDWQTGLVVDSKRLTSPQDHAIASADKTYLIRGTVANEDQALVVGATVRFAVEDKNLFLSIAGKEYKLFVLGVTASGAKALPAAPPVPATPPATPPAPPAPVAAAAPPTPPVAPKTPVAPAPPAVAKTPVAAAPSPGPTTSPTPGNTLDNDAIVKMVVGGLKDDTVVSVIQARPGKYALGSDAVTALKAAGVSPSIIAAMTAKMQAQR